MRRWVRTKMPTPTTGGMISQFHLPMRAHPRCADAPTVVTHVTRASPTAPGHSQQKPSHRNHGSGHHSNTVLTSYAYIVLQSRNCDQRRTAAFNRTLLTNEIEASENEYKFECFIRSSNSQTSFNIPNYNQWQVNYCFCGNYFLPVIQFDWR